tara:strand:+ start:52 stop:492 length:441 start_codon:yes stop_codon:yes gene_type:complete
LKKNKEKLFKNLGKIIKKERLKKFKSLSLRKFSQSLGMTHVAIKNIEDGKVEAKKETLIKLANKLGLDKDEILAKAAKLDDDIETMISEKSHIIPQFLRMTEFLSDYQWDILAKQVKKMDSNNNLDKTHSIKIAKSLQKNLNNISR